MPRRRVCGTRGDTAPLVDAERIPSRAADVRGPVDVPRPGVPGHRRHGRARKGRHRGVLETPAAKGALLDNAGQLGYWVMRESERDRLAMPVRIDAVRFSGPAAAGLRLHCTVRIKKFQEREVVADFSLDRDGKTWAKIPRGGKIVASTPTTGSGWC